jgi:hypothetical protein
MKNSKTYYKELPTITGFKWSYFDNGLHSFIKKVWAGYLEIKVNDDDIESGSYILMMERNFSRK